MASRFREIIFRDGCEVQRRFFEGIPNLKVISNNYTELDKEMLEGIVNCLFGVVF